MKTKLLKKLRKNIKLTHDKKTGQFYIYDAYRANSIYSTENDKVFRLRLDTINWQDKEGRLKLAKYEYRHLIIMTARDIFMPIRIKNKIRIKNQSWWSKLFAYCG